MDSLRAIAALSVLTIHIALPSGLLNTDSRFREYWGRLDVGVAVFFLISGFLLYRPFVRARAHGQARPPTGAYAWRRALRIVPAYWLVLTVVALAFSLSYVFTGRGLWTYYGFAQIYENKTDIRGVSQAWTLCIEVTFYPSCPSGRGSSGACASTSSPAAPCCSSPGSRGSTPSCTAMTRCLRRSACASCRPSSTSSRSA